MSTADVRKDWDTYFMDIAYMVSTRSRCSRRHVGPCWFKVKIAWNSV